MYRVVRPVSKLIALLPAAEPPPTLEDLERNLWQARLPVTLTPNASGSRIRAQLEERGAGRAFEIEVNPIESASRFLEFAPLARADQAHGSRFFISLTCKLLRDVLDSLHAQVRLLAGLAPGAVAIVDVNAFQVRTGDWMRDVASASVPPAPTSFFSIHPVFGEGPRRREAWLHTHGLHRMGSIELEIVGIRRRDAAALTELIKNVAKFFLDCGVPMPNTRFEAGDGLPLVWLPWDDALKHVGGNPVGAAYRDGDHGPERGVLLAPAKDSSERLEPPRRYVPAIEADPIFYFSPGETERMQKLARERLPSFLTLQGRFAKNRKWEFHVKLGIPCGPAGGAEHLWFEVHEATTKTVDATLLNHPYIVTRLREGQRGSFDLRLLTDWSIDSPRGRYTPETVLQLERALTNDGPLTRPLLN